MGKKQIVIILIGLLFSYNLFATEYKVAVRAHHGVEAAYKQWEPTLVLLNEKIPEHVFNLLPIVNLNEITKRAETNEFQFVLTNPSSFVEIKEKFGAKALVTLNNKRGDTAQSRFGSVIFTHARNENILSINDLAGKTLVAVSEPAFGGWRVAWLEMLDQGFNPMKKLKKIIFTESKTQSEVVFSVLDGKADVGVVRTDRLERMEASGKIDMRYFRILNNKDVKDFPFFLSTKLYPEWAFSAMKSVPQELIRKVTDTLLTVSENSDAAKAGKYVGWVEPLDYSSVRELMKKLEVGFYEQ